MTSDELQQEADVMLSLAHITTAAARVLPEGNEQRARLLRLAEDLFDCGQERLEPNPRDRFEVVS